MDRQTGEQPEVRLKLALESAALGLFDLDLAEGLVYWSPRNCEIHGVPPGEPLGLDACMALLPPDEVERVREALDRALHPAGDGRYCIEHRIVRPDGGVRWVHALGRVSFETDAQGVRRAAHFTGVTQDITDRYLAMQRVVESERACRRSEERLRRAMDACASADSEARFRLLADTMPQIVWSTRPDGYHDYFNERWYEYTGMPRPDEPGGEHDPAGTGQGWNWKDWLHPDDQAATFAAWSRSLATGEPYHVEYRFKRRDGAYRWFIGRALPLRDAGGAITRWFGTLTDIDTERRALDALREADHRKDEFLAMLAHELRNPLAPLVNAHRLLARDPLPDEQRRAALAMAERQTRQLTRLVDDLLEVSRITRGKIGLRCERVMVNAAIYHAVESMDHECTKRRHAVTVHLPPRPVSIHADPARLAQVLENLLANACKYTPDGGRIDMTLAEDGEGVEIRVRDTGIGIEADKLETVFELFHQVDATLDRAQGGLGIGLGLVKRLVELHGGRVHAESAGRSTGATFVVWLPRRAADEDRT